MKKIAEKEKAKQKKQWEKDYQKGNRCSYKEFSAYRMLYGKNPKYHGSDGGLGLLFLLVPLFLALLVYMYFK